jgi:large subunit ribosomal protein L30
MDNGKLIAIVRIRGSTKVSHDIEETMIRLNLKHANNCTVVKLDKSYRGMISKCQNHVAFGEIDEPTLSRVMARHLPEADAKKVMAGDTAALKDEMPFRLHPPKRGYRAIKLSYQQGGALGYMGSDINSLIKRMV